MAFLEVNNIVKSFGKVEVLKDISFTLNKGEVLAIIGSSGSGKTTLLRCLNFLETPDIGVMTLDGEELFNAEKAKDYKDKELRIKRLNFGLVFQSFHLFPQYNVLDNITLAPKTLLIDKIKNYKKQLKLQAKQQIKQIKAQAKSDISDVKYKLFLELKKDNKKVIDKACKKIERKHMKELEKAEYESKPKRYSIGEEIFNSITHGIGVGLAIAGLVLLIVRAVRLAPQEFLGSYVTGVSLFGASMIILYLMSTLYHALTPYGAKKVFAIFDHCSIYILIAGTYTPFCIAFLRGALGWTIFGIIWGLAVLGIVFYSIFGSKMRVLSVITYILMGWLIIFAFKSVKQAISTTSLAFLLSGGVAYMVGVIFYAMKKIKWTHCIWHLFVLMGTVLHFFSVMFAI